MFFSAITVVLFTILFAVYMKRDKGGYVFFSALLSTAFMTLCTAVYIAKTGVYIYVTSADFVIYNMIYGIPISFFTLGRLHNIGAAVYMASALAIYRGACQLEKRKSAEAVLLILVFLIINDPVVTWRMFSRAATDSTGIFTRNFEMIRMWFDIGTIALFFFGLEIKLIVSAHKSALYFKKRRQYCISLSLSALSAYLCFMLFRSMRSKLSFGILNMINFPDQSVYSASHILMPFLYIACAVVVLAVMAIIRPFGDIGENRKQSMHGNKLINNNLASMMHAYKNAFCSIENITELLIESRKNGNDDEFDECVGMIKKISGEQIENLARVNSIAKRGYLKMKKIDVSACVKNALKKSCAEERVKVYVTDELTSPYIVGAEDFLTEAFYNIIDNAADATAVKKYEYPEKPELWIGMHSEENYCIVKIRDNGVGIPRGEYKNLFKMFYSTKKNTRNSGIGLCSANYTIQQHDGYIHVESKKDKFTEFSVFLPQA